MKLKAAHARKAVTRPGTLWCRTDNCSGIPPEERERRTLEAIDRHAFMVRWLWRRNRDSMGGRVRLYGGRIVVRIACGEKGWRWYCCGQPTRGSDTSRRRFASRAAAIKDAARQCRGDVGEESP